MASKEHGWGGGAAAVFGVAGVVGILAGRLVPRRGLWVWCAVRERCMLVWGQAYEDDHTGYEALACGG